MMTKVWFLFSFLVITLFGDQTVIQSMAQDQTKQNPPIRTREKKAKPAQTSSNSSVVLKTPKQQERGQATKSQDRFRLLKCLGREEEKFHMSKDTGPIYRLNQLLISKLIHLKGVKLKDNLFDTACKRSKIPSIELVGILLTNFEDSFEILKSNRINTSLARSLLKSFTSELPKIYDFFIELLKQRASGPHCLKQIAPELELIDRDRLYISDKMSFKQILSQNRRFTKVFGRLKDFKFVEEQCRRLSRQRSN